MVSESAKNKVEVEKSSSKGTSASNHSKFKRGTEFTDVSKY